MINDRFKVMMDSPSVTQLKAERAALEDYLDEQFIIHCEVIYGRCGLKWAGVQMNDE